MFKCNYSQQFRFDVWYCRKNRHGTHIFNLKLEAEGCPGYALAKIHLSKNQEIQIDFNAKDVFGVFEESKSLGIFKDDITEKLSAQITVQQLEALIR